MNAVMNPVTNAPLQEKKFRKDVQVKLMMWEVNITDNIKHEQDIKSHAKYFFKLYKTIELSNFVSNYRIFTESHTDAFLFFCGFKTLHLKRIYCFRCMPSLSSKQ